jgi:hypothetical protein
MASLLEALPSLEASIDVLAGNLLNSFWSKEVNDVT